jgi:hypothetical protein
MIHYQLRCSSDHAFDGWFRDSAAFDEQARRGFVECPSCGDVKVRRALMAPAVPRKGRREVVVEADGAAASEAATAGGSASGGAAPAVAVPATPLSAAPSPAALAAAQLPDEVRAVLQRMRAEVERRCEYVGETFAAEARRIHTGEAQGRPIYGETTPEEAEALADEGIEVARIPWVPRADG